MDFISYIQENLLAALPELIAEYEGAVAAEDLSSMEQQVKELSLEMGNEVIKQWLEAQDEKYPSDEKPCPYCDQAARYVRRRQGMTMTLQGRVYYGRSYYSCAHCHRGHYPLDKRLGIEPGQMSQEVVKTAALQGIADAFETSSDMLARQTLLELSPNSIRKACQIKGEQVIAHEQALHERSQEWEAQLAHRRDPDKPQRLYGSMDGFKVLLEDGWREMKAGAWWTTTMTRQGDLKAQNIHYYTDLLPAHEFSDLVWTTGFEQKADQALELVFVADGAEWIWRIVEQHYPHAVQIVDWYHATAYLTAIANAAFAESQAQQSWLTQQREHLWEGRLGSVFHACRALMDQTPETVRQALVYFAHNRTRLRYAKFRARGLQIGSGSMESGCKQLGTGRLKIAGARWTENGIRMVAKARAAYLSGQWDELSPSSPSMQQVA